jgi:hypothetical protein
MHSYHPFQENIKNSHKLFIMLNLYFSLFYFGEIYHLPLFMKCREKLPVEYYVYSPLIIVFAR